MATAAAVVVAVAATVAATVAAVDPLEVGRDTGSQDFTPERKIG